MPAPRHEPALELRAQLMRAQLGRVDQDVGPRPDRHQQVQLALHAQRSTFLGGQRMTAARFGKPAQQHLRPRVEIQQLHRQIGQPPDPVNRLDQRLGREIPVAYVNAQCKRSLGVRALEQALEHRQRQVVDGLEADVLQRMDGRRAPRARRAGDHDQRRQTGGAGGLGSGVRQIVHK